MGIQKELKDHDLLREIALGNHDCFEILVNRHTQTFFNLAYRTLQNHQDAEDVIQRVFLDLWQNPRRWDERKGAKFTTWLYKVVVNRCLDHKRKHHRSEANHVAYEVADYDSEKDGLGACYQQSSERRQILESKQVLESQAVQLESWISELPESQQTALNLVIYQQLPQKEVADIMETSVKAVESLLSRAKKTLKKRYQLSTNNLSPVGALV